MDQDGAVGTRFVDLCLESLKVGLGTRRYDNVLGSGDGISERNVIA